MTVRRVSAIILGALFVMLCVWGASLALWLIRPHDATQNAAETPPQTAERRAEVAVNFEPPASASVSAGPQSERGEEVKPEPPAAPVGSGGETEPKEDKDGPKLALVIDDFGYNSDIAESILKLDLRATWAIIPTAPRCEKIAALAVERGQPFLLHVPMQALIDSDGGRGYMIGVDTPKEKIVSCVAALRRRFPKAVGVNNHRGSKATAHKPTMQAFMQAMAKTNWGFIDSRTTAKTVAEQTAREYHVPVARNDAFIDGTEDLPTMKRQLTKALKAAKKRGFAVAICHARVKTLPFLEYLSKLDISPVRLVSADEVWKRPQAVKEEKR